MSKATPAKDFDCVQFMREARDRITARTASMTIEERVRWFNSRQHDDPTLAKLAERGIRSIAVPALGSGFGGLAWSDVRPRIEKELSDLNSLDIVVFEPKEAPERVERAHEALLPTR